MSRRVRTQNVRPVHAANVCVYIDETGQCKEAESEFACLAAVVCPKTSWPVPPAPTGLIGGENDLIDFVMTLMERHRGERTLVQPLKSWEWSREEMIAFADLVRKGGWMTIAEDGLYNVTSPEGLDRVVRTLGPFLEEQASHVLGNRASLDSVCAEVRDAFEQEVQSQKAFYITLLFNLFHRIGAWFAKYRMIPLASIYIDVKLRKVSKQMVQVLAACAMWTHIPGLWNQRFGRPIGDFVACQITTDAEVEGIVAADLLAMITRRRRLGDDPTGWFGQLLDRMDLRWTPGLDRPLPH